MTCLRKRINQSGPGSSARLPLRAKWILLANGKHFSPLAAENPPFLAPYGVLEWDRCFGRLQGHLMPTLTSLSVDQMSQGRCQT